MLPMIGVVSFTSETYMPVLVCPGKDMHDFIIMINHLVHLPLAFDCTVSDRPACFQLSCVHGTSCSLEESSGY